MFKFGFSSEDDSSKNEQPLEIAEILKDSKEVKHDPEDRIVQEIMTEVQIKTVKCNSLEINYFNSKEVIDLLRGFQNVYEMSALKAEENGSDLIPREYEGGMKIWECTYDLLNFLETSKVNFKNTKVLDLGCGAGLLGIYALRQGAQVIFQDYNEDVIQYITIPNVKLNSEAKDESCGFYSGEWGTFTDLIGSSLPDEEKFDFIVTSETIYNIKSFRTLQKVFSALLKKSGVIFLAAKLCYFGVGGSVPYFEDFLDQQNMFKHSRCWECTTGVKRSILKIEFK